MRSWQAVSLLLLGAAIGCGLDVPRRSSDETRGYHGTVLGTPLPRPDFTLTDTEGRSFDFRAETEGRLTLLFIGYTHCPDVCPVHMASIGSVLAKLPEVAERTRVVFVTADPRRDTPERLRKWLNAFDHRFVGLRGSVDEIHRIEDALALPRSIVSDTTSAEYEVGHAAVVVAFSPNGPAHVLYPFGTRQADYAADLPRLLRDTWEDR